MNMIFHNKKFIKSLLILSSVFGLASCDPINTIVSIFFPSQNKKEESDNYFEQFQLSLEYIQGKNVSRVDTLTTLLLDVMNNENDAVNNFKNYFPNLGNKFFVAYVQENCALCEESIEGFKQFEKDNNNFKLATIFVDEETSYTTDEETSFSQHLYKNQQFYEEVGARAYDSNYYANGKYSDYELEAFETADPENFLTPTVLLVELDVTYPGATELMFKVEGENASEKSKSLSDCWQHTGDFSLK